MKYIKSILLALTTLFIANGVGHSQRNIILTHGFGDNNSSWNVYQPFLRTTLTTPNSVFRTGYNSNLGVQSGVGQVNRQIASNNQNIAIGQSMGGIVLRDIDRQFPNQKFGGIITLGSPNRGGVLLNNLTNGSVQAELNDGCQHIAGAVGTALMLRGLGPTPLGLSGLTFVTGTSISLFRGKICDAIITNINSSLPTQTAPVTVADLSEGSQIINNLTNANTPTFKMGVFGVENSPVHMRVLSSLINDPSLNALSTSPTTDNSDQELVDLFNTVSDVVAVGEVVFTVAAVLLSINAIWNWPLLFPAAICAWTAYEWGALRRWMNQSEAKWHALIGAGGFFQETVNVRFFNCNSQLDDAYDLYDRRRITVQQLRLIEQRLNADPNCFINLPQTIHFPINNQSDGLFNAGTQRIPLDPNSSSHVVNLPVQSVNHREFFNHSNMTNLFQRIFAGNTPADIFFITN